jgi:hypothetical protein
MIRFLSLLLAAMVVLTASCSRTKLYTGKNVCELLTNNDIAAIMGEPFKPGSLTRLDNEDDEYIGSYCSYESEARSQREPKLPEFRINVRVTYVEPEKASLDVTRRQWEKTAYNGEPFYTNIHEVPGIGDATLAATDYNRFFQTWSLIRPSTEMEVLVSNVAVGEAEERGLLVARKMLSRLQAEPKLKP